MARYCVTMHFSVCLSAPYIHLFSLLQEQPVANMVHFSAPPLPAQGSMLSAQMPDSLIQ